MGHSRAAGSCGFYGKDPVVVLDFASLYPSLFVAHNICWTTLRGAGAEADDAVCPASAQLKHPHRFASKQKRPGLLPRLLEALITTRRRTKALGQGGSAARRHERGGVPASAPALAQALRERVLRLHGLRRLAAGGQGPRRELRALGQLVLPRARDVIEAEVEGAEVLYAQTDSLFIRLPGRSHAEAAAEGARIAAAASAALPEGLTLEHEHTLCPFLLLHVNRYAGRDVGGEVVIKGIGSARGDTDFVRSTLKDATTALLERGVEAACALAAARQEQLLRGDVALDSS